jgi:hypothetical protein
MTWTVSYLPYWTETLPVNRYTVPVVGSNPNPSELMLARSRGVHGVSGREVTMCVAAVVTTGGGAG